MTSKKIDSDDDEDYIPKDKEEKEFWEIQDIINKNQKKKK